MLISMIAAKLNIKSANQQARLKKKRASLEKAYGKNLEACKTSEEIDEWLLREDPYMAELFTE